jgi:hypothetical protein
MKIFNLPKIWMRLLIAFTIAISIPILLEVTHGSSLAQVLVQPRVRRIGLPFKAGQYWYVCQGYNGTISHGQNTKYGKTFALDLSFTKSSFRPGGTGCQPGTNSASNDQPVLAPVTGNVTYMGGLSEFVCLTPESGGGSLFIGHLNPGSRVKPGRVEEGTVLGTVNPEKSTPSGYAHIHIEPRKNPSCTGNTAASVPLDDANSFRFYESPNLPDIGGSNQHYGTELVGQMRLEPRFRTVNDWATKRGYRGGYPNFHWTNYGKGPVYGSMLIKTSAADWRDIPASELGNPKTPEDRFRAVSDWAARNGYRGGYPNFHQANYGRGVVYGAVLIKREAADWRDIPANELGNPQTPEELFRAVSDWAARNGYRGGYPNFHWANYGRGVVYGAVLIKREAADGRDISVNELN